MFALLSEVVLGLRVRTERFIVGELQLVRWDDVVYRRDFHRWTLLGSRRGATVVVPRDLLPDAHGSQIGMDAAGSVDGGSRRHRLSRPFTAFLVLLAALGVSVALTMRSVAPLVLALAAGLRWKVGALVLDYGVTVDGTRHGERVSCEITARGLPIVHLSSTRGAATVAVTDYHDGWRIFRWAERQSVPFDGSDPNAVAPRDTYWSG